MSGEGHIWCRVRVELEHTTTYYYHVLLPRTPTMHLLGAVCLRDELE